MLSTTKKLREILTRREKFQVGVLLIAIIAMAFSQALGVASVLPFISLVMEPEIVFENRWLFLVYETFNFNSARTFIIFAGIFMFAIIFISNAISAFTTWVKLKFTYMNNYRLSRRLMEKYINMPYSYFLDKNSSELSTNVLSQVSQLTGSFLLPLLNIITRSLMVIFILAMLFWVDIAVSFTALFFISGTYALIYWRVNKNLKDRGAKLLKASQMSFKAVSEAFGGIKEIKVLNREPYFLNKYAQEALKAARYVSWNAVVGQLPRFALEAVAFGGIIIFVLILLLTQDDARQVIPLASLFAFAGYRLMPALQEIFTCFTQMQFSQAVLDRIYRDLTEGDPSTTSAVLQTAQERRPALMSFQSEIRLDQITYNYPNTRYPVIEKINLSIKHNTAVAFVGPTGAGKTTLVDIILGLLPPQRGKLIIDDQPIDQTNLVSWQQNIGYVPQYIYLSDDIVARNIAFGIPETEIDQAALERAARIANIHDFIMEELPHGYDTLVGERGIRLSGGQRQRIGIARAIYHDPAVLIFDEATSALDGVTEEAVLDALENAAQLKTLIIIAHRLTTVKNCDLVYMIDRGRIVGSGTYDELLSSNEQFKKMAKVHA